MVVSTPSCFETAFGLLSMRATLLAVTSPHPEEPRSGVSKDEGVFTNAASGANDPPAPERQPQAVSARAAER